MQKAAKKPILFVVTMVLIAMLFALFAFPAATYATSEDEIDTLETSDSEVGTLAGPYRLTVTDAELTNRYPAFDPENITQGDVFEVAAIIPTGQKFAYWEWSNVRTDPTVLTPTAQFEIDRVDEDAYVTARFIPDYPITANSVEINNPTNLVFNFNDTVSENWAWSDISFMQVAPTISSYGKSFNSGDAVIYDNSGATTILTVPATLFSQHTGANPLTVGTYRAKITFNVGAGAHIYEYYADFTLKEADPVAPTNPTNALPSTGDSLPTHLVILVGIVVALMCLKAYLQYRHRAVGDKGTE